VDERQEEWFDNSTTTDRKETLEDLILQAGLNAKAALIAQLGDNIQDWQWKKIHQIEFVNPIMREGPAKGILGGKKFPIAGSGETLYRAKYDFDQPAEVVFHAALRMVADMNDSEKVMAVVCGGSVGRSFSNHLNDQLEAYISGEKSYWWFSPEAVQAHQQEVLVLQP